jgi:hypothetical protein
MKRLLVVGILGIIFGASLVFGATAGSFQLPYNPNQQWKSGGIGYKDEPDQYFMEFEGYSPNTYHMAEDWNGIDGTNTDKGGDLLALADGVVQDKDYNTPQNLDQQLR